MRKVLFAVACWATVGLASSRADVSYRYVADSSNYTGALGDKVNVQLLLQETVTGASTGFIFADGGLFGAGVLLSESVPGTGKIFGSTPTTNDFAIAPNTAAPPAGFGSPTQQSNAPADAGHSGLIVNGDTPGTKSIQFASGSAGVRSALLGTINITVGAAPVSYKVTNFGGGFNTITQAGTDLDFGTQAANGYTGAATPIGGFFTFTVGTAIPEPTSMAFCGLLACGMSYAGYRRRKATASEPITVA